MDCRIVFLKALFIYKHAVAVTAVVLLGMRGLHVLIEARLRDEHAVTDLTLVCQDVTFCREVLLNIFPFFPLGLAVEAGECHDE